MEQLVQLLPIVGIFVVAWFLLIRPQRKKEKTITTMRNNVKVGDDIVTIGGLRGKVIKTKEEVVTIQIGADKVKLELMKWGISKVETEEEKRAAKAAANPAAREEELKAQNAPVKKPKKLAPNTADVSSEEDAAEEEESK